MRWSILVAMADPDLRQQVYAALFSRDMTVTTVGSLADARSALGGFMPSILVLDAVLPDGDGLVFCRALRDDGWQMPIILIGPSSDEDDIVSGFEAGADDYLVKPFGMRELQARVGGQLRHLSRPRQTSLLHRVA